MKKPYKANRKSANKWRSKKNGHPRISRQLLAELLSLKQNKKKDAVMSCSTRTVELPSTHQVANEKNKLLFALALGMIPKYDQKVEPSLIVKLERLHPAIEVQARTTTENRINELVCKQRVSECQQQKRLTRSHSKHKVDNLILVPLQLLPDVEEPRVSPDIVEIVDLLSDDDNDDENIEPYSSNEMISLSDEELDNCETNSEDVIDLSLSDDDDTYDDAHSNSENRLIFRDELNNLGLEKSIMQHYVNNDTYHQPDIISNSPNSVLNTLPENQKNCKNSLCKSRCCSYDYILSDILQIGL